MYGSIFNASVFIFFEIQQLIANWVHGLLVIVIVDWQERQGSLGSGQNSNIKRTNVRKGMTTGKNVKTFHHVQVTNFCFR